MEGHWAEQDVPWTITSLSSLDRMILKGEDDELQISSKLSNSSGIDLIILQILARNSRKEVRLYLKRQQAMELARHLVDCLARLGEAMRLD